VLRRALPRFFDMFQRHGVLATLFVVGSDIATSARTAKEGAALASATAARALLKEAVAAGHELGNHSFSHRYELARLSRAEIEREIGDCHQALRSLTGRAPIGFRAPGYEVSAEMIDVLEAFGYRYDSSLFPCPAYYLAKLAVLGKMTLFGQRSAAIVGRPLSQLAPTQPYRPDTHRPWRRGQASLVELPIGVTRRLRLPGIGTSLLSFDRLRPLLLQGMDGQRFWNFEMHGMDLLDIEDARLPETLASRQPELRVPLKDRLRALDQVLARLRERCEVVPLAIAAEQVQRRGEI